MTSARPALVVHDARTNNLAGVTVAIPSPALTVVTGVSGSGKSSLVFETIAKESQRQLNEVFPLYIRNRLPRFERPAFERIDNLAPAIVVDQKGIGRSARSTVGTLSEVSPMLRVLFSRCGVPSAGESTAYSFNAPAGMCPECAGLGQVLALDVDRLLDRSKSLHEGAIGHPAFAVGTNYWKRYATAHWHVEHPSAGALGEPLFDPDKKLRDYTEAEMALLLYGSGFQTDRLDDLNNVAVNDYEGVVDRFHRRFVKPGLDSLKPRERAHVEKVVDQGPCPECGGSRLSQAVRDSRIDGYNIADMSAMQVSDLIDVLTGMAATVGATSVLASAITALRRIDEVGLGYLSLDRSSLTLSGGEGQRLKTVKHLGSSLTGMTYVFDEPSIGLHARDVERLIALLNQLRDKGNIVLVVEHDRAIIEAADHVVDIGPGAGTRGGRVTFEGSPPELVASDTTTGTELRESLVAAHRPREPVGHLPVRGATLHNLRDMDVDVPLGVLTAVTGVAGSGKSTLTTEVLPQQHPDVVVIDQSPVGINPRSTPATYAKIWDRVRQRFARENQVGAGLFSFNADGACPGCRGRGEITHDMAYLDPVTIPCETCDGRRFSAEALRYTVGGQTIADIVDTTIDEAVERLDDAVVTTRLRPFTDVGLGYLTLGRSLAELSGGERQRVKLASRLTDRGRVFVFDEPTTGLHMADVRNLVGLFDRIVDAGNTVIAIEHDLDVVAVADWVIDMGPGAGSAGGHVIFQGRPADLATDPDSLTGRYLATATAE